MRLSHCQGYFVPAGGPGGVDICDICLTFLGFLFSF